MPSNHLILCLPLLLLPSIFLRIRVFSNESALLIRWPKYWSFSFRKLQVTKKYLKIKTSFFGSHLTGRFKEQNLALGMNGSRSSYHAIIKPLFFLLFYHCFLCVDLFLRLLWWLSGREFTCQGGDIGSIPGLGRSPEEGTGNPFQYFCLGNPMDRGAWQAIYGVTKELDMTQRLNNNNLCIDLFLGRILLLEGKVGPILHCWYSSTTHNSPNLILGANFHPRVHCAATEGVEICFPWGGAYGCGR